ncbi:MAG: hypothetical protein KDC48_24035, partial [Planctomycetes bacterium]|nr:hypothetical protein [Planctomycetota bacterium]
SIKLGAQEFFLTVRPYATITVPRQNRDGWLIVGLGNLLSGAIGLVFWKVGARAETLERMVGERTLELEDKHRELEVEHRRALDATRLKSEFLANMTHELKSPIHSILTLSDLLRKGLTGELNAEQLRQVDFIHRSGGDLLRLIDGILTSARLEAEKIEVMRRPTRVDTLIEGLRESSSPLIASKGLAFEVRVE